MNKKAVIKLFITKGLRIKDKNGFTIFSASSLNMLSSPTHVMILMNSSFVKL